MKSTAVRVQEATQAHQSKRVEELSAYHRLSDTDLDEAIAQAQITLDEAHDAASQAEDNVAEIVGMHEFATTITPNMVDDLREARERMYSLKGERNIATDVFNDLVAVLQMRDELSA